MTNIIQFPIKPPTPDPWRHAQPSLTTRHTPKGEREELWSHPYYGVRFLIWATGSNNVPDPPSPTGGTPAAANQANYTRLRVAA